MFKKHLLTLVALLIASLGAHAQNLAWGKQMGGRSQDIGRAVAVDAAGNVYTTGLFYETVDFDPGANINNLTAAGNADVFITKFDAAGNFVWAKQLGGSAYDDAYALAVDAAGNVYTTGFFDGKADFDPGAGIFSLTADSTCDAFVSKLDAAGNFVWAKRLGGNDLDYGRAIALDDAGNVYTTGTFHGTADFDPGMGVALLRSAGLADIFTCKLDAAGNFVWAKAMGGPEHDYSLAMALDASGHVYTTGYFDGKADFDPGMSTFNLLAVGASDIFVSKLDAAGNFVWAKQMGGYNHDYGYGVATDVGGNVYLTGSFFGNADFDPNAGIVNLSSSGDQDIFIAKLNPLGNFMWAKQMGGTDFDCAYAIAVDRWGAIYTTGTFFGKADLDPGNGNYALTATGRNDMYVNKLDTAANLLWAMQMVGNVHEYGHAIAVDGLGQVYGTGLFYGTANFGVSPRSVNLSSSGQNDIFVWKLSQTYAYVSNTNSNTVSAIDMGTYTTTATIAVDKQPTGIAVSPNGSRVYVANNGANTVSVIGAPSHTRTATIAVGNAPYSLTVSPDGNWVFVTNSNDGTVSVIHAQDNTRVANIPVGNTPKGICISPNGLWVYVANSGENTVSVINTTNRTVETTIPVGTAPQAICMSPNGGRVYVTNSGSDTVSVINTTHKTLETTIPVGINPQGINMSPDGNLVYVANNGANTVSVINTASLTVAQTIAIGGQPKGLSVSPDGNNVVVANSQTNDISIIDTRSNTVLKNVSVGILPNGIGNMMPLVYQPCSLASLVPALPNAVKNGLYSQNIIQAYSIQPAVSLTGGTLPPGLNLSGTGLLSGAPTALGTYAFTVSVSQGNCYGSLTQSYQISVTCTPPATPVISGDMAFCAGDSTLLFVQQAVPLTTYLWSNGSTGTIIQAKQAGLYSVRAIVHACTSDVSNVLAVSIKPIPDAPLISGKPNFCEGSKAVLSIAKVMPQTTYLWSNGLADTILSTNTESFFTVRAIAQACTSQVSKSIRPLKIRLPSAPALTGQSYFCKGDSTVLRITNLDSSLTYLWNNGTSGSTLRAKQAGSFTVFARDSNMCSSPASAPFSVNMYPLPPAPTITATGRTVFCAGDSVRLVTTAGFAAYRWSNGSSTPQTTVRQSGDYHVTVTDTNGCSNTSSKQINIYALPKQPVVTASRTTFCAGDSVRLSVQGGYASYRWSNGARTQAIYVKDTKNYSVQVTDTLGCSSNLTTLPIALTINPLPAKPVITSNGPLSFCAGDSVQLIAPTSASYLWSNGTTTRTNLVKSTSVWRLSVSDANACQSPWSDSVRVTQNALPNKPIITTNGAATFCEGDSVSLTAPGSASYLWANGAKGQTIIVKTASANLVRVWDNNGCPSPWSDTLRINTNPPPAPPTLMANGVTIFCTGGNVQLMASTGFVTYEWNNSQTGVSLNVNQSGSYQVRGRNAKGCQSAFSDAIEITVLPNPDKPIIATSRLPILCDGDSLLLSAPVAAAYQWSNGAKTQQIKIKRRGSFTVKVTDTYSCTSPVSDTVSVTTMPKPPKPVINKLDGDSLLASVTGVAYTWTRNDSLLPANDRKIYADKSGRYKVQVLQACGSGASSAELSVSRGAIDLSVYPNPSNGLFKLLLNDDSGKTYLIAVHDMLGRVVQSRRISKMQGSIDLSNYPNGAYLLRIWGNGQNFVRKLTVVR